jgi:hypothetical protein
VFALKIFRLIFVFSFCLIFFNCSGKFLSKKSSSEFITIKNILETSKPVKPAWTINYPEIKTGNLIFVGLSENIKNKDNSKTVSIENGINSLTEYTSTLLKDKISKEIVNKNISDKNNLTNNIYKEFKSKFKTYLKNNIIVLDTYFVKYNTENSKIFFKCYTLIKVSSDECENLLQNILNNYEKHFEIKFKDII